MKRFFALGHKRRFDKFNPYWDNYNWRRNPMFVSQVQDDLNERLQTIGWVSLNEALRALGFAQTRWGDMYGWIRDPEPGEGDGYISFGIWNHSLAQGKDWVLGKLDGVTLHFNVDPPDDPLSYRARIMKEEGKL